MSAPRGAHLGHGSSATAPTAERGEGGVAGRGVVQAGTAPPPLGARSDDHALVQLKLREIEMRGVEFVLLFHRRNDFIRRFG